MRIESALLLAGALGAGALAYTAPRAGTAGAAGARAALDAPAAGDLGPMPEFAGATGWINSPPIARADLKGKVVVVDVWTFACSNCQAALPYVKALHANYAAKGLVVVGVHTPELKIEYDRANVERALKKLGVNYPVVLDNDYRIWNALGNRYWPAIYIVDRNGRIRYHNDGEGDYARQEQVVQHLLAEK